MSHNIPLAFSNELAQLSADPSERHEEFVDFFGQFLLWLRSSSLRASRKLVDSEEARSRLGTIRREYYEGVANLTPAQRDAAMLLAEETLDGYIERLLWCLGDQGTDAKFGSHHAYRFRVEMEIVDVDSGEIVWEEAVNRGSKNFLGKYWGRWLNRYGRWREG